MGLPPVVHVQQRQALLAAAPLRRSRKMKRHGALPALVQAASQSSSDSTQVYAAYALQGLARGDRQTKAAIVAAGGGAALLPLLTSRKFERVSAAMALLSLAWGSGGSPANDLIKDPLAAARAMPALAQLLDERAEVLNSSKSWAKAYPAWRNSLPNGNSELSLLGGDDSMFGPGEAAAAVLFNLANSSEPGAAPSAAGGSGLSQPPTVTAGMATALVQLLRDDRRSVVQQAAASVLRNLAAVSQRNKAVIASCGAEQELERLLSHSNSGVRSTAAGALRTLRQPAGSQASDSPEQAAPPGKLQLQR